MTPLDLPALAAVVGGTVHDDPDGVLVTGPAFLDSRAPEPGGLFAAFAGERVDGHRYAAAAVAGGAAAVLGSRPVGVPAVVVPDVRAALAALATHVLAGLPQARVIGLTGSQGKTSTKDLLAAVLADVAPTVATQGSFNNELGLPLTVLRADASTRTLVLEMGARGVGHLAELCRVARPDVSVVLNVGKAHLGEFGSREAIAQAKGELVEALTEEGTAVLNADDPLVAAMASRTRGRVLTFGTGPDADVRLDEVDLDERGRPTLTLHHQDTSARTTLRVVGRHHALNAAAAAAAALAVGVPLERSAQALGRVAGLSRWRMEVTERHDGLVVVNDAYNANPDSMAAALEALVALGRGRRTLAVLGEMRELGESGEAEHEAVGRLAVRLGVAGGLVVGEAARGILRGAHAQRAGQQPAEGAEPGRDTEGEEWVFVADNAEATAWLAEHTGPGDAVLVKASNGARLYDVAAALLEAGEPGR